VAIDHDMIDILSKELRQIWQTHGATMHSVVPVTSRTQHASVAGCALPKLLASRMAKSSGSCGIACAMTASNVAMPVGMETRKTAAMTTPVDEIVEGVAGQDEFAALPGVHRAVA